MSKSQPLKDPFEVPFVRIPSFEEVQREGVIPKSPNAVASKKPKPQPKAQDQDAAPAAILEIPKSLGVVLKLNKTVESNINTANNLIATTAINLRYAFNGAATMKAHQDQLLDSSHSLEEAKKNREKSVDILMKSFGSKDPSLLRRSVGLVMEALNSERKSKQNAYKLLGVPEDKINKKRDSELFNKLPHNIDKMDDEGVKRVAEQMMGYYGKTKKGFFGSKTHIDELNKESKDLKGQLVKGSEKAGKFAELYNKQASTWTKALGGALEKLSGVYKKAQEYYAKVSSNKDLSPQARVDANKESSRYKEGSGQAKKEANLSQQFTTSKPQFAVDMIGRMRGDSNDANLGGRSSSPSQGVSAKAKEKNGSLSH